jgi:hypothetical protein
MTGNGEKPVLPERPSAMIVIRLYAGGLAINWLDCDVHQVVKALAAATEVLGKRHQLEQAGEESGD